MMRPARHIYVIRLSKAVLKEKKFLRRNPNYGPRKKCIYVGLTGKTPAERFEQHKNGIRSRHYIKRFGKRLLPGLGRSTFRNHRAALKLERELAERLTERGFGFW